MKKHHYRILFTLAIVFVFAIKAWAQPQISCPSVTACPCQTVAIFPSWNNVSNVSYTLVTPGTPTIQTVFTSTTAIFQCTPVATIYTYSLYGSGIFSGGPITSTTTVSLSVVPPAPLTFTNNIYYCPGDNAVITVQNVNAANYTVTGSCMSPNPYISNSNVVIVPVPGQNCNGGYTVTAVSGGCTMTGVTNVSVAPSPPLNISAPINVCNLTTGVTLSANINPPVGYEWYYNGTLVGNSQNLPLPHPQSPSPGGSVTPADAGTYTLIAKYSAFTGQIVCSKSTVTQVNVIATSPVTVNASPAALVCQGTNLILNASAPGANFSWTGPAFTSTVASPIIPNAS
ncbi:MAG: hypothetical protein JNL60_00760, partial [Bacteroidia bacterium]|nr:hypothetical protein [Bacteroidia bacterium]